MDSDALAALYDRYGFYVQQRCQVLLGNRADAEDVTQEVFVRVQRYGSSLTAPVTLSWLYTIAMRCCIDRAQKRSREEPHSPEQLAENPGPAHGSPDDGDRRALISGLLRGLDPTSSEIAILHHVEGWTQEEIAVKTGYSRKTVGKRLSQFADALRTAWERVAALRVEARQ